MITRPSFDHEKVILQNLDDSAIVLVDHGEFGKVLRTVSDVMIEDGAWKTTAAREKTIDEILLYHILTRKPFLPCKADTSTLREALMTAIRDNPCPAYTHLGKGAKGYWDWQKATTLSFFMPPDSVHIAKDDRIERIRW